MVKDQFITLIKRQLVNGDIVDDNTGVYHDNVIAALIDLAVSELSIQQRRRADNNPTYYLQVGFDAQVVVEDTERGYWKVTLPAKAIGGQRGVLAVRPKRKANDFPYRSNASVSQIRSSLVVNKPWEPYYVENNLIIFEDKPHVDTVFVLMVPSFLDLDGDQEINLGGNEGAIYRWVMEAILSKPQMVEDVVNQQTTPDQITQQ